MLSYLWDQSIDSDVVSELNVLVQQPRSTPENDIALQGARIITMDSDRVIENGDILIDDDDDDDYNDDDEHDADDDDDHDYHHGDAYHDAYQQYHKCAHGVDGEGYDKFHDDGNHDDDTHDNDDDDHCDPSH